MSEYPCAGCGARVEYAPGTTVLRCPYCGYEQQVADTGRQVREHDFAELATLPRKPVTMLAAHTFVCQKCGAQTESNAIADRCQFCAAPLVADVQLGEQIAPEAVLPFAIDQRAMREALGKWARSRWLAPSSLKKVTDAESTRGTYLPHWTFDAKTVSDYLGQRGEHYYETETYTENGETRTREVQHTRWYPASGQVSRDFDDVLIPGTQQVAPKHLHKLDPWPLDQAVAYQPAYLAGYQALRYDTEPEHGFEVAKTKMAEVIEDDCERDIGGDEQRVNSVHTNYFDLTYKLMLLPVWIAVYLHAGKTFQILVNGRTGEVVGERPWSPLKVALAILTGIAVLAVIIFLIWITYGHGGGGHVRTSRRH
jgi:DNA-directed RNA polymerase subunit RPC12/RpoP